LGAPGADLGNGEDVKLGIRAVGEKVGGGQAQRLVLGVLSTRMPPRGAVFTT